MLRCESQVEQIFKLLSFLNMLLMKFSQREMNKNYYFGTINILKWGKEILLFYKLCRRTENVFVYIKMFSQMF